MIKWAIIENIATLTVFTLVAVLAPDAWKMLSVLVLLNLNYFESSK